LKFFVSKRKADILVDNNTKTDIEKFGEINPKIWRDTEYVLGWLPLGGYCQCNTEFRSIDEDYTITYPTWDVRSMKSWKQLFFSSAGIIVNLVSIILFYVILFSYEPDITKSDEVNKTYVEYSPYAKSLGFQNEDKIVMIDTLNIKNPLVNIKSIGKAKRIAVLRGDDIVCISLPEHFADSIVEEARKRVKQLPYLYVFVNYRQPPLVKNVISGSRADKIGIRKGDQIISINSTSINSLSQLFYQCHLEKNTVTLHVARRINNKQWDYYDKELDKTNFFLNSGLEFAYDKTTCFGILQETRDSIVKAQNTLSLATEETITDLMSAAKSMHNNPGIGGLASIIKDLPISWSWLSWMLDVIWLSLGIIVFNLLPIPQLDGGRIIISLCEIIFRRKINEDIIDWINGIAFIIYIIIVVWINIHGIYCLFQ
jgi:regulator of sigma E protease